MDVWAPRSLIPLQLLHSDPHTLIHTQSREPLYPRKELEMGSNEKTGQAALMRNGVTRQVYWSANCLYSTSHFIPLYLNFLTLVTSQTLLILPLPRLCFPLKIPQKSLVQPPNALPLHHVPYPMEWSSLVSEVIWRAASLPHGVSGPMAHGAESLLGQAWQGTGQELVFLTWTKINTWIHWASFVTVAWKTLRGDLLGCLDTKKKKALVPLYWVRDLPINWLVPHSVSVGLCWAVRCGQDNREQKMELYPDRLHLLLSSAQPDICCPNSIFFHRVVWEKLKRYVCGGFTKPSKLGGLPSTMFTKFWGR